MRGKPPARWPFTGECARNPGHAVPMGGDGQIWAVVDQHRLVLGRCESIFYYTGPGATKRGSISAPELAEPGPDTTTYVPSSRRSGASPRTLLCAFGAISSMAGSWPPRHEAIAGLAQDCMA